MNDRKLACISKKFEVTVRKQFPNKSIYTITLELNKILEELMYGKTTKKKRKHN